MAGRPKYLFIFLMPSLRLEIRTLADYTPRECPTGPPHCSHRLRLLDVGVVGLFKGMG